MCNNFFFSDEVTAAWWSYTVDCCRFNSFKWWSEVSFFSNESLMLFFDYANTCNILEVCSASDTVIFCCHWSPSLQMCQKKFPDITTAAKHQQQYEIRVSSTNHCIKIYFCMCSTVKRRRSWMRRSQNVCNFSSSSPIQVNVIFFLFTVYFISFAFIKSASILVHHLLYKLKICWK